MTPRLLAYVPAVLVPSAVAMGGVMIYSRLMTAAEFGRYALIMTFVNIAIALVTRWLQIGVTRLLPAAQADGGEPEFVATAFACLAGMLGVALAGLVGVLLWRAWAGALPPADLLPISAGFAIFAARTLVLLATSMHRARHRAVRYAVIESGQALGGFALSLLTIAICGPGASSVLAGTAIGYGAVALAELFALIPWLRAGRPRRAVMRRLLAFSGPLTLTAAMALMLQSSERLLLQALLGPTAVGLYSAVASVADRSISLVFAGLTTALFPLAVSALEQDGTEACRAQERRNVGLILAVALPATAGLMITAPAVSQLMLGPAFSEQGAALLPWIAAASFAARMAVDVFDHAFYLSRRTGWLFATLGPALAFSICCNLVLIPRFGLHGAAYTALATALLMLALSAGLGARVFPIPLPVGTAARVAAATLAMMLAVLAMPHGAGAAQFAAQVMGGVAAYSASALLLNVMDARAQVQRVFKAVFRPLLNTRLIDACTGAPSAVRRTSASVPAATGDKGV